MAPTPGVRRAFVDLGFGQIHYRYAGEGRPLWLCHASPGSAKQLERTVARLARDRRVIAPDTPGNGDSAPLPIEAPTIADYAAAHLQAMDALEIDAVDVYGTHTGAAIAGEMALIAPGRVGKVIMNGIGDFTPPEREAFFADYAHPFVADLDGAYLARVFMFCRDQYLFFPWYARDAGSRRDGGLPRDQSFHDWVLEVLKARLTYHHAYRAAFAYPAAERAALISQPLLVVAAINDPLHAASVAVAASIDTARYRDLPRLDDTNVLEVLASEIEAFLRIP